MTFISLKELYEKVGYHTNHTYSEPKYLKKSISEDGLNEIIDSLSESKNGYIFLVYNVENMFAIRLSYEKDDINERMERLLKRMGDDQKKYLLELRDLDPPIPHEHIYVKTEFGLKELFFDKNVFKIEWEQVDSHLKRKLEENFETKLRWFIQFLKGLKALHSLDILHLDIKLANLFLIKDQIKIGDFEFYFNSEEFLKVDSRICGASGHIAPEIFCDRNKLSAKCDIFSTGIAFCQFFTGSELPHDLLRKSDELSDEEQEEFQGLFGNISLEIRDPDLLPLFRKNYRVFSFFKHEVEKKIDAGKLSDKERKIHELLLTMIEIDPESRPDVDKILFKIHEIEFNPAALINRKLLNRYTVQELLDGGGRGLIFKVWDPIEETARAIKLFPPQFNFIRYGFEPIRSELRYIPHRNIVNCYGLQRDGDLNFIVMEYIKGFTLKKKLDASKGKKLKEIEALEVMKQVASGLIEAHRNGVIHRNLKDTNIMVTAEDNQVKIINFGLSLKMKKEISETTGQDVLGSASLLFSPPEYLEKIWNEDNAQIDVWGFGAILYQLLMGKPPFDENDLLRDPAAIPAITGVSEKTKNVIMKCLEKERPKRYRNMEEVYQALFEEQSKEDNLESGKEGKNKKIPGFFQHFKKKWVMGFIFVLIAATLWLILGTNLITGGKKYEMWYSGKPGNIDTPGGGIGYAASPDGIQWERDKSNPIIPQGSKGRFNEFESSQPFLVHDGQFFHLLFSGNSRKDKGIEYHIGYVRFERIVKWTENNIDQIILDAGKIKFPGPIIYDGLYKMWYTDNGAIYHAATTAKNQPIKDMVKNSDNPVLSKGNPGDWDQESVIIGSVLFENGEYHMWYTGISKNESKIGYAISKDGINWNKYVGNPVFDDLDVTQEMNPCIIHDATGYKMYYTAATTGIEYYPVRLATSTDGIKWEKHPNPQVLDTGSADWEKAKIFVTGVMYGDK